MRPVSNFLIMQLSNSRGKLAVPAFGVRGNIKATARCLKRQNVRYIM